MVLYVCYSGALCAPELQHVSIQTQERVIAMIRKLKASLLCAVLLLAGALIGQSGASTSHAGNTLSAHLVADTTGAPQSSPDDFTLYANTKVHDLPVMANDASKGAPNVAVCRFDSSLDATDYGWGKNTDYTISLHLDPYFSGTAHENYQLCDTSLVGPLTDITLHIIKLRKIGYKRLDRRHVRYTNNNAHSVLCVIGSQPIHKVDGNSSRVLKSVKGTADDHWTCLVHQPLGDAVAGSYTGL